MNIPAERDMPAGHFHHRREHLVMTVQQPLRRRRRFTLPALTALVTIAAGGGAVAVAAQNHSSASPGIHSTAGCPDADWRCPAELAAKVHQTVLAPPRSAGGTFTGVIAGPTLVSYYWGDPKTNLLYDVQSSLPKKTTDTAPAKAALDHHLVTVRGQLTSQSDNPDGGILWNEEGQRFLVMSGSATPAQKLAFVQALTAYPAR